MRKALKIGAPVLGVLLLAGAGFGLHEELRKVSLANVTAALAATPRLHLLRAAVLLALSMGVMAVYDLPGILFARRGGEMPRLGAGRIALASFCAYALSHVLGVAALTAAAIRLRLYAHWGVPAAGITRIIALSGTNFTLGLTALVGALLLLHPAMVPLAGNAAPDALRLLGAALAAIPVAYVALAQRGGSFRLLGREVALPGARLAGIQILLSCVDISLAGAVFYAVLPRAPGLDYPHALGLYVASFAAGMYSGLPAGVGVFDSVLLLALSAYLPTADALGAILLFRVLYFLIPACLGGICYAAHELWAQARR